MISNKRETQLVYADKVGSFSRIDKSLAPGGFNESTYTLYAPTEFANAHRRVLCGELVYVHMSGTPNVDTTDRFIANKYDDLLQKIRTIPVEFSVTVPSCTLVLELENKTAESIPVKTDHIRVLSGKPLNWLRGITLEKLHPGANLRVPITYELSKGRIGRAMFEPSKTDLLNMPKSMSTEYTEYDMGLRTNIMVNATLAIKTGYHQLASRFESAANSLRKYKDSGNKPPYISDELNVMAQNNELKYTFTNETCTLVTVLSKYSYMKDKKCVVRDLASRLDDKNITLAIQHPDATNLLISVCVDVAALAQKCANEF